jgi:hypothetical protein
VDVAQGVLSTNDDAMADQQASEYLTPGSFAKDIAEDGPGEGQKAIWAVATFTGSDDAGKQCDCQQAPYLCLSFGRSMRYIECRLL